jgi:MFS family permease
VIASVGGAPGAPRPGLAIAATLAVQAIATLALTAPSVMAPAVAPLLGLPPQRIGWFVGIAYFAAMLSGLAAGTRVASTGPIRMSRMALVACAVGLGLAAAAALPGLWVLLLVAPLALGIGYGLPNPSASMVLVQHAPTDRRGLFFSIKQTGVPIGVGLAGLVVPLLLVLMHWASALAVLAGACLGLALLLRQATSLDRPTADPQDAARDRMPEPERPSALRALVAPLRRVLREPPLRRLGVASLVFSMTQLCFVTFLVSYLKLEHGRSLAAAAGVLSASQLVSMGFRVLWGQVADRWMSPLRLLAALGLAMGVTGTLLGALPPDGPPWLALAAALACAATAMAWNGVFYAELVRRVRADELATLTGGIQVLTFCGAMVGPVAFATLVGPLGSHAATFVVMAPAPVLVGLWLLAGSRSD